MNKMLQLFEDNPVIPAVKDYDDIEPAIANQSQIVFTLFGDVSDIMMIVKRLKDAGKTVFVNIDLVDGFASKNSVLKFMKEYTEADGIISSKGSMVRAAREIGFCAIHRFFVLDSASYRSMTKQLEISKADFINVVPGWSKVIEWTVKEHKKPVIAAGLVCDKKSVFESLNAGAIAISSTNHDVWDM